ncbi:hypothetical protein LINPERPRIM_LOCUS24998 [Linum perenne]
MNGLKLPTLQAIARDLLVVLVTSVASECVPLVMVVGCWSRIIVSFISLRWNSCCARGIGLMMS